MNCSFVDKYQNCVVSIRLRSYQESELESDGLIDMGFKSVSSRSVQLKSKNDKCSMGLK